MLLHNNKDVFSELIEVVSAEYGLREFQIEKDYYVSLFLKELAIIDEGIIVFKGGTSLSKCYSAIDRFSEDIDLAMVFNTEKHVTQSRKKKVKQLILNTIESLGFKLLNQSETRSKRDFNRYRVHYESLFENDSKIMQDGIIVETIAPYRPYPCEVRKVTNYITEYLRNNEEDELISKYDMNPFDMKIQTVERTFTDKVYAICDYHLDKIYHRHSRHIYDIHMLWSKSLLDMSTVEAIMADVIKDRQLNGKTNRSCQPGTKINEILKDIIVNEVYKEDYENITLSFIHKKVSYDQCINTINEVLESGLFSKIIEDYSSK